MTGKNRRFSTIVSTRRDAIRTLGGVGLGAIALAPPLRELARMILGAGEARAQACSASPALDEGPYYVEGAGLRRNVIEKKPGTVLWVSLKILDAQTCAPIPNATVEIWHADASGAYSGVGALQGTTFLRGRQIVGASGVATFRTIYPGWYPGRTPHIHVKAHVAGNEVFTGQVFFDEGVTAAVYAGDPYRVRGTQDTTNANDGIFAAGAGRTVLALAPRGKGYWGAIDLVVG